MDRRTTSVLISLVALIALLTTATADARAPRGFFGIAPQTPLTAADTERMRQGGIGVVRMPFIWSTIQPSPGSGFDWSGVDSAIATTARSNLSILPVLYGSPQWVAGRETNLPVGNAAQRQAWADFVRAAVERYGPRGQFWNEHWSGSADPVPRNPVRRWQVWNEPNFFYFATPATPQPYARLLKATRPAIKGADPRAEIILAGLFGNPKPRPPRGMASSEFLDRLYKVGGIKRTFDGVALHPYAPNVAALRKLTERLRRVVVDNRDRRTPLYITEMGWGSQNNRRQVAFEVGLKPQARELRGAYRYLIGNRGRLNLRQVHWYSWKDLRGSCNFCDSVGLFRAGTGFHPKPAWHAFVAIAKGRAR